MLEKFKNRGVFNLEQLSLWLVLSALVWITFWFGGVHPVESWVGFYLIYISGFLMALNIALSAEKIRLNRFDICALSILFLYILLQLSRPIVKYYAYRQTLFMLTGGLVIIVLKHNSAFYRNRWKVVSLLTALGFCVSLYSIAQFATNSDRVLWFPKHSGYINRFGSVFVNPNHCASFINCILPFSLSFALAPATPLNRRVITIVVSVVMLFSILITLSRGGWIALVVCCLFLIYTRFRLGSRVLIQFVLISILCFCGLVWKNSGDVRARILKSSVSDSPDSGLFRIWLWRSALDVLNENKAIGVGPGQFQVAFPKYRPPTIPTNPEYAHNEYLEILVEYGYIGIVLFIIIFVRFIVMPGAQRLKNALLGNSTNPNESTLTIGAFGSSLSLFVHLFFDFSLHIPAVMLVLIISTLLVGKELENNSKTPNGIYSDKTSKTIMLLMVTTLSVIGLIGYTRLACEDLYLKRAERRSALGWTRLDNLYSASRVASDNPTTYIQIAEELRGAGNSDKTNQNRMLRGAIMYLSNSISLNPLSPTARMRLGLCYEDLGDLRSAKEHLLEANKIGVNDVNILNSLARVMIADNDVEAARKIVDQSIGVNWWRNIDAYYLKNVIEYSDGGSKR